MPSILDQANQEIDAHDDLEGLILLMPEDQWSAFLSQAGVSGAEAVEYRGVTFRKAPVTAIIPQEGF